MLLRLIILAFVFLCLSSNHVVASTHDELIKKLEMDDWEDLFYKRGELNKYKSGDYFNRLVDIAENKGLDWHIRIKAIRLLSFTKNIAVPDILIKMLYDPFFNHECPAIKSSVAEALGNFKEDSRVVDALIFALDDGEIHVREASVDALGKIGHKKAIPYLLKLADDKRVALRIAAIRSLGEIGDRSVLQKLIAISEKDATEEVRITALNAIEKIKR